MYLEFSGTIQPLPANSWNQLVKDNNPFLRHEFFSALENTGCVGGQSGWCPQYLLVFEDSSRSTLLAAVPLYLKTHSYGEYIFDWAWANAYQYAGLEYYPKLVVAVPFTPASGPRLLLSDHANDDQILPLVTDAIFSRAETLGCSSVHWLFCPEQQATDLRRAGYLKRKTYQYHWVNQDYRDFNDYLANLSAKKRKNIRHERRDVGRSNITIETLNGKDITPALWSTFYQFYIDTIHNHGAMPYLKDGFFHAVGMNMADNVLLFLARYENRPVAGALFFRSADTLYGRYWGSLQSFDKLHFELCYYQAIEYCIRHGLQYFEAGAQGPHKLSRGLLPTPTYSAHWLRHPQFNNAIAEYLQHEESNMNYEMKKLNEHTPFKASPLS